MVFDLPKAAIDPIFAVAEEAKKAGPQAINASVGMILDEEGKPYVLPCVRKAAEEVPRDRFAYPPLLGLSEFRKSVTRLVFGSDDGIASIAATGGTGALAINLRLLKLMGIRRVILPVPTWPNHRRLLSGCAMEITEASSFTSLLEHVRARESQGILLQTGCHNPVGRSWSPEDWHALADTLKGTKHVLLLDCAYQGLGKGVEDDVAHVYTVRAAGIPLLLAWSASKNHTVYGLRTGLACAVAESAEEKEELEKHYSLLTREIHSAAAVTGQHVVSIVQERYREEWIREIGEVRALLRRKRRVLIEAFPQWKETLEGEGLFTVLPIGPEGVQKLKKAKVFMTEDGRINIGGISLRRMEEFIEKVSICQAE